VRAFSGLAFSGLALGIAAALAAVAWLVLLLGHGGFWRTDQRLPPPEPGAAGDSGDSGAAGNSGPAAWPEVVAVVPARDEAAILPVTLPALLGQDYPGPFSVTLVDDGSSDGTGEVAAAIGASAARALPGLRGLRGLRRLRVLPGAPPPPGWAGKPWAMTQGLDAARAARDSGPVGHESADDAGYVLFTDADIAWGPGTLSALVAAAEAGRRDLTSQMVLLRTETRWEKMIIPAFVYFFAQLYPFRWVNRPGGRTAAAAGGCMLVRRSALGQAGGLAAIRGALIDDVALGRLLKRPPARGRIWLGLSTGIRSVRPYLGLADLWNMVARSAFTQLRYSPWLLAGTLAGLAWLYALPVASTLAGLMAITVGGAGTGPLLCVAAGLTGWAAMTVSYLPMLRLYRLSPLRAPLLPATAILYAAMTADSARRHYAGRGGAWKGRTGRPGAPGGRESDIREEAHS
jgi:hopene-associated glycosyltransferase HpnB